MIITVFYVWAHKFRKKKKKIETHLLRKLNHVILDAKKFDHSCRKDCNLIQHSKHQCDNCDGIKLNNIARGRQLYHMLKLNIIHINYIKTEIK